MSLTAYASTSAATAILTTCAASKSRLRLICPRAFTSLTAPGQRYAVFEHRGHIAGIRATISTIWSKWLPESSHQATDGPSFERYGPEFNPLTGLGGFEIWIPIQA